jgi:hypothetical protein
VLPYGLHVVLRGLHQHCPPGLGQRRDHTTLVFVVLASLDELASLQPRDRVRQPAPGVVRQLGEVGHPQPAPGRLRQTHQDLEVCQRHVVAAPQPAIAHVQQQRRPFDVRAPLLLLIIIQPPRTSHGAKDSG